MSSRAPFGSALWFRFAHLIMALGQANQRQPRRHLTNPDRAATTLVEYPPTARPNQLAQ
jgi:hypothetical protein